MRKRSLLLGLLILALPLYPQTRGSDTGKTVAGISFISGTTYIQRVWESTIQTASVDMPVFEGDRLGTAEGRMEISLGGQNYLRLDRETKIDLIDLPRSGRDRFQIRIWMGSVYVAAGALPREKSFEVHTGDVSIYLLNEGTYRLDVRNTETEVFVFSGLIEAAGGSGSVMLKQAQKMEAIQGHFTSGPAAFSASIEDGFDRWNEYRDSLVRKPPDEALPQARASDFDSDRDQSNGWFQFPKFGAIRLPLRSAPPPGESLIKQRSLSPRLKVYPSSPFISLNKSAGPTRPAASYPSILGRIYNRLSKSIRRTPVEAAIKKKAPDIKAGSSGRETAKRKKKKSEWDEFKKPPSPQRSSLSCSAL